MVMDGNPRRLQNVSGPLLYSMGVIPLEYVVFRGRQWWSTPCDLQLEWIAVRHHQQLLSRAGPLEWLAVAAQLAEMISKRAAGSPTDPSSPVALLCGRAS